MQFLTPSSLLLLLGTISTTLLSVHAAATPTPARGDLRITQSVNLSPILYPYVPKKRALEKEEKKRPLLIAFFFLFVSSAVTKPMECVKDGIKMESW